jgi:glycosyltransferase involved in cell wall biosynthesis
MDGWLNSTQLEAPRGQGAGAPLVSRPVVFNGKFLSARPTGVQRVARCLLEAMDRLLLQAESPPRDWSLACPSNAERPIDLTCIQRQTVGRATWQAWEQLELPAAAAGKVLVNLCNTSPLSARRSVTMIHDAQVFLTPRSNSWLFGAWYRFALPRIGAAAARIITVSRFSRDRLVEYGIASADRITVIHNGADHLLAIPAEPAILDRLSLRDRPYVLASANTQQHKNIALLFAAWARPGMEDVDLVLAGPHDRAAFAAAEHSPPPGVVFAGHVGDGELRALYEGALCFAFPSTTEGFGLPPLEAMTLGCPALVAPCGAVPEVCGGAALYREADDAAGWAEAVLELQRNKILRACQIAVGLKHATRFRWADAATQLLEVIRAAAD